MCSHLFAHRFCELKDRVLVASVLALLILRMPSLAASVVVIDTNRYHLGIVGQPEWDEFARLTPQAPPLEIRFPAETNLTEYCLLVRQDNVKQDWPLHLNGRALGKLFAMEAPLVSVFLVPPGGLRAGTNLLALRAPKQKDDIQVGDFTLLQASVSNVLSETFVEITVQAANSGKPIPCRITITDEKDYLAALWVHPAPHLAIRPGVVYSSTGQADVGLRAGRYRLTATRGSEYGLMSRSITLAKGDRQKIQLQLGREVDTTGWVSSDTHSHTFTYSRHGDASTEERMVTLAGEGIELPIATDHNLLTDYTPALDPTSTRSYLTPVIGNEVTTPIGHFNIFPVVAGSRVPDFRLPTWPALLRSMRETPGVRVVILNHPHNVHSEFEPFAKTNFHSLVGRARRTLDFSFDAMELVNSSALQSDPFGIFDDWFGILNAGHRIVGVGSSDGHDVSRYIIGQGRTYIRAPDDDPSRIDISRAAENLLLGRAIVSLGLFPQLIVAGRYEVGDVATNLSDSIRVEARVDGPAWMRVSQIDLFANGELLRQWTAKEITGQDSTPAPVRIEWQLPRPRHDVFLVLLARGPGVTDPAWAIARPYQPRSTRWLPQLIGATNPIWLDADGDGKFTAAREYARRLVQDSGGRIPELLTRLAEYSAPVVVQAVDLLRIGEVDIHGNEFAQHLLQANEATRKAISRYLTDL